MLRIESAHQSRSMRIESLVVRTKGAFRLRARQTIGPTLKGIEHGNEEKSREEEVHQKSREEEVFQETCCKEARSEEEIFQEGCEEEVFKEEIRQEGCEEEITRPQGGEEASQKESGVRWQQCLQTRDDTGGAEADGPGGYPGHHAADQADELKKARLRQATA